MTYSAADDCIIGSLRHQDCLIGINRTSGELAWILGSHANWKQPWADKLLLPEAGLEWPWHQHDCSVTPAGTVLCFDNGNHKAAPFDPKLADSENYSRAVEYEVNQKDRTVRQIWARGQQEDGTFSVFQSGAYRLPATGNTFITYGGVCTIDGKPSSNANEAHCSARLIEVTPGQSGEVVFEMVINDPTEENPVPYASFRAEHFPELGGR